MLFLALKSIKAHISVYDGISPALLATISLSQNIKGSNHIQLIESLKTSNIIQSQNIIKTLKTLDRSYFTNDSKIYDNKPNKISKGQNMTDIFSHSIILNNIQNHLKTKKHPKILDIGTGHGYLAFAVWKLAQSLQNNPKLLLGIDCYQQCIQKCNQIKHKLKINDQALRFSKKDVKQILQQKDKYDIVLGGFFIQPNLSSNLQNILQDDGIGIWPQLSQSGQGLYITRKNKPRQYILQTLFSQQIVQSSVQQYFINDHSQVQQNKTQQKKQQTQEEQKILLQKLKAERNQKKTQLQKKLKQLIQKYQHNLQGKVLSLKQMQKIPQIVQVLTQLKKFK